jgi:hypothetical protein
VREEFLGVSLPDPFYWNFWADLEAVRSRYIIYCALENIDPQADDDEDQESVTISWDTQ